MLEYLKEWNEACAYAGECLPPSFYGMDFDLPGFFIFIVIIIGIVYLHNERKIDRQQKKHD